MLSRNIFKNIPILGRLIDFLFMERDIIIQKKIYSEWMGEAIPEHMADEVRRFPREEWPIRMQVEQDRLMEFMGEVAPDDARETCRKARAILGLDEDLPIT